MKNDLKSCTVFLFLLLPFHASAQTKTSVSSHPPYKQLLLSIDSLMENSDFETVISDIQIFNESQTSISIEQKVNLLSLSANANIELQQNTAAIQELTEAQQLYQDLHPKPDSQSLELKFALGDAYSQKGAFQKGNQYLEEVIKQGKKYLDPQHELVGLAHNALGSNLEDLGQLVKAEKQYELAIKIFESSDNKAIMGLVYNNLGVLNRELFNLELSIDYYKKALSIFLETEGKESFKVLSVYYNVGVAIHHKGDYSRSFDFIQNATNIADKILPENHPIFATFAEVQIHNYFKLGKKEEAKAKANYTRKIRLLHAKNNPFELQRNYNIVGGFYSDMKQFPQALENYEKGLKVLLSLGEDIPLDQAIIYGLIGIAHSNLDDFEKANDYIAKAYKMSTDAIGEQHPEPAGHLTEWAYINLLEKKYDDALQRFDKAMIDFGYRPNSDLPYQNISDFAYFLDAVIGKGTANLEKGKAINNMLTLEQASTTFQQAANILTVLKTDFNDPLSKLSNIKKYYEIFEKLIETELLLFEKSNDSKHFEKALMASEESKAYLLLDNLRSINAKKFGGIADSLVTKESKLKANLDYLQYQYFEASQAEVVDENQLSKLQNDIFSTKNTLNELIETFKTQHPKYFNLKYQESSIDFRQIQKKLNTNESLIEYFVGDSSIYIFHLTAQSFDYQKIKKDFPLDEWVKSFREGLLNYHKNNASQSLEVFAKSKAQYQEFAFLLYNKLLSPFGQLNNKLIIVPDGNLWYIPFESLLTKSHDGAFRNAPYLIRQQSVSYQYAINLWLNNKQKSQNKNKLLAFAPTFQLGSNGGSPIPFDNLKFNQEEVENIGHLAKATILKNTAAKKSTFLQQAKNHNILHLATHAQLNPSNNEFSYLAFSPIDTNDWKLYVNELYNMELDAQLVVLSACEAGTGEVQIGEGLTSLGRGFTYAGAKNIVSTLWQVNDQATSNIMLTFYESMKKGQAIDGSLQQAKLAYLNAQKEDRLASPFYWAAFTTIGETSPLELGNNQNIWLYVVGIGLLLSFIWIWRRKGVS